MQDRSSKRPSDPNQLAKLLVDISTGQAVDPLIDPLSGKNAAAVALGRIGGLKGGLARAKKLSAEDRKAVAVKAANARWQNKKGNGDV
jgi:hypothetical protein